MDMTQEQIWLSAVVHELRTMSELPAAVEHYGQSGPTLMWTACLEAALLHARLLIEFVAGRPKKDGTRRWNANDVDPTCFLEGWSLSSAYRFDDWLYLIDRHLAHLSKDRATPGAAPPGYLTHLVDDIVSAMDEFASALAAKASEYAPAMTIAMNRARTEREKGPATWPLG
jgi:hypothetical protein